MKEQADHLSREIRFPYKKMLGMNPPTTRVALQHIALKLTRADEISQMTHPE